MREYCAGPVFDARYPGHCPECDEDIESGEELRMVDGQATHADCHDCTCATDKAAIRGFVEHLKANTTVHGRQPAAGGNA